MSLRERYYPDDYSCNAAFEDIFPAACQKMGKQVKLTARYVREYLPPRLRIFKWLTAT